MLNATYSGNALLVFTSESLGRLEIHTICSRYALLGFPWEGLDMLSVLYLRQGRRLWAFLENHETVFRVLVAVGGPPRSSLGRLGLHIECDVW